MEAAAAAVVVLRGGDLTLAGTVVRLRPAEWPMAEDEGRGWDQPNAFYYLRCDMQHTHTFSTTI